ncbi:MAG: NAD(P)H-hydrate dehydratase [Bacteroides sp.]|nr:NAD(P)H-hydrate dehydratase [Bacteroides sp.]
MKILPTSQIKELDAYTIEHEPIRSIDLMERAATALTEAIAGRYTDRNTPFIIFAGPGNNGGDALAVARLLSERGYAPEVYLFNPKEALSPDCEKNRNRLYVCSTVRLHEVSNQFTPPHLTAETVVIDGLFGSGLKRPLEGGFASVVKYLNASAATVVAIDIPSGLMGEDNGINNPAHIVRASWTLSLQLPKLAFLMADCEAYIGEWQLLDIGLSTEAIREAETDYTLLDKESVKALLKPRRRFSHKGNYGRALLIAGSQGMAGASVLSARACLRSGVGLLTVHLPFCNNFIVQTAVPEAMTQIDYNDVCFSEAIDTEEYTAVAIGPGLGQTPETEQALLEQIETTRCPMVIDADALNLLGRHREYLQRLPQDTILTPHPKELERLTGRAENSYERLQQARRLAMEADVCVVLKGAYSAICTPDGRVVFNPTGNPGMATGGTGDVLTGILLALLAQGYKADEAARLGVYLHGLAGDVAALRLGEVSLLASDVIEALPEGILSLSR